MTTTTKTPVTNQTIALAAYKPHPRNYNVHPESQIADLRRSLRRFQQVRSIVVQADGAAASWGWPAMAWLRRRRPRAGRRSGPVIRQSDYRGFLI